VFSRKLPEPALLPRLKRTFAMKNILSSQSQGVIQGQASLRKEFVRCINSMKNRARPYSSVPREVEANIFKGNDALLRGRLSRNRARQKRPRMERRRTVDARTSKKTR
jgi:hypothetical protein